MQSELKASYPDILTRDVDWASFFRSQIWKDIKYILSQDSAWGMMMLMSDKTQDMSEVNMLRGKMAAYNEIIGLEENIPAIISGGDNSEDDEDDDRG